MKTLFGPLAIALLGLGIAACGGSSRDTTSQGASNTAGGSATATAASSVAPTQGYLKNDRDNDGDHNDDDAGVLLYGHAANAANGQTITALVTHYFAAAAAQDGARACSLLAPFIAESVAETYGHTPPLLGRTCAVVMSKLFKQHHGDLVNKNAALHVIRVGLEGNKGLVALYFPTIPEVRQIAVRRSGGTWKMLELLDGILE